MRAALGIDELRIESHPLARVLYAAFEDVSHAELAADLAGMDRFALIGKAGAARDHEDTRTTRQISCQRFGDAIDKRIVLRIAADVEKRQNHKREPRRFAHAGYGRGCRLDTRLFYLCGRLHRRWPLGSGRRVT